MKRSGLRTFAEVERQMKKARLLRAETISRGSGRAVKTLLSFARGLVERLRGARGLAIPG